MKGIKPIKTEKGEFEHQEDSISKSHLGSFFRLSKIWIKSHKLFKNKSFYKKLKVFIQELERKMKPLADQKFEFAHRDKSLLLATLDFSDYRNSYPPDRSTASLMEFSFTGFEFSIKISMEGMKKVKTEKKCVCISGWTKRNCTYFH